MDTKVSLGRGVFYLTVAQGIFFLAGLVIHVGLGRYLGPEEYGIFGVILALVNVVNLFLTSGFPQGAAKYIAEDDSRLESIVRDSNRIQVMLCALIFALYFGLSSVIAELFNDPGLVGYIRLSALIIPAAAFGSVYVGYLIGMRRFAKQATASIAGSIAKVLMVYALVFLGLGLNGAIVGYCLASLVNFLLAWKFLGLKRKKANSFGWTRLARFGTLTTLFSAAFFLLTSIDLFAVKAIGGGGNEVGYYTSATTIAQVLRSLLVGLSCVMLPAISRSIAMGDIKAAGRYTRQASRYMLMLLLPAVVLVSATSSNLVSLLYSSQYVAAGEPLRLLVFGQGMMAVFGVFTAILQGSGKPGVVLTMTLILLVPEIVLNIFLIPRYGLTGAAAATTLTAFMGMTMSAVYVRQQFGTLVSGISAARMCLASAVIYVIALNLSASPAWLPLVYAGLFALYIGLLLLSKELRAEDWETFKRVIPLGGSRDRVSTLVSSKKN